MKSERRPWFLLTGLVLGLAAGLFYAWILSPAKYLNTTPASLRADFKDRYRALIAAAFVATGDGPRARTRLALLGDADTASTLAEQAQQTLAEGNDPQEARALGLLAVALGQGPSQALPVAQATAGAPASPPSPATGAPAGATASAATATPASPVAPPTMVPSLAGTGTTSGAAGGSAAPSRTPLPTGKPLPTRTPTAVPPALFSLQDKSFICDPDLGQPLIQISAEDRQGNPAPGVEVVVSWDGSEDHFFTGLKADLGLGYADFSMTPGVTYAVSLANSGQSETGLTPAECETESGERYWGSWLLVFVQK